VAGPDRIPESDAIYREWLRFGKPGELRFGNQWYWVTYGRGNAVIFHPVDDAEQLGDELDRRNVRHERRGDAARTARRTQYEDIKKRIAEARQADA